MSAGADKVRFLLLAGVPPAEPEVQHRPFAMTRRGYIEQTIRDCPSGDCPRCAAAAESIPELIQGD